MLARLPSRPRRGHLTPLEIATIAEELRARAPEVRLFEPPAELVDACGFKLAVTAGPVRGATTASTVVYAWSTDPRRRGLRIYVGLARAELLRLGRAHDWHDVWQLALALAVPLRSREAGFERLVLAQHHCPERVLRDVLADRWG
jgi:hypothetical protein